MTAQKLVWHDIAEWGFEGKGWKDTERLYDRLPVKAKGVVPQPVWDLSHSAIGMCATFKTNASRIVARWKLAEAQLKESNFTAAGFSGLDLYADDNGTWRWVGAGHQVTTQTPEQTLIEGMAETKRAFRVYLPLRNPVDKVEIGIEEGASFQPVAPRKDKPLVFYGTSIVHGAYGSHAGIIHPSLLGRWLNKPVINLGFSGNARMEPALAELLAEINAEIYVIDALPNMDAGLVNERAETFIRLLRKRRPKTPIVLVEDRPNTNAWIKPAQMAGHEANWRALARVYRLLCKEGMTGLSYVKGKDLFGTDNEGSLDSSHPSDLGFMRMAQKLHPVLKKILGA